MFGNDKHRNTAPFKEAEEKIATALDMAGISESCCATFVQYSYLRFYMPKPSHVTNIHWKFEDFLTSNLGVIKVLHISNRSEYGVNCFCNWIVIALFDCALHLYGFTLLFPFFYA